MSTTTNRAGFWSDTVWSAIDTAVTGTVGAIRVAQKVFQATPLTGVTSVPADVFDPATMTIEEGTTRPYVELARRFSLTNGQVNDDPNGTTATTLATLAARTVAVAEDITILRGTRHLPPEIDVESGRAAAHQGILDLVQGNPIRVNGPAAGTPLNSGGEILAAITEGIARLTREGQTMPWALIADTESFAAMWGSLINGAPTYNVLTQLVTGGIYSTDAMPRHTALLAGTGGNPTTIYYDTDATTEPTTRLVQGRFSFRIFERIQFVARDQRAFVILDFSYLNVQQGQGPQGPAQGQGQGQRRERQTHNE